MGLPRSLVLSTLPKPTIVLVIPDAVPVNEGLAVGAFADSAVAVAVEIGLFASLVLPTLLKQTMSLVYNTELISGQKEKTMWSLQALFGQKIDSLCPVADVSNVYMDLGSDGVNFQK